MGSKSNERKAKKKRDLWTRQRCRCFYCDKSICYDAATLDHVVPKSKGGGNHKGNLVVSCWPCNSKKRDSLPRADKLPKHFDPMPTILRQTNMQSWEVKP